MALTQEQVSQLYVALFGRASEGSGNKGWIDRGLNQVDTANEMIASPAAKDYFGGELTNLEFVTFIYANTLGFTHDKEGIANWTAKLDAGISRGGLVVDMITAALSSEFKGSAPQNQLLNRIEVSNYMATNVENVAPENVASTQFVSARYPNAGLDVTDSASKLTAAKKAIDAEADAEITGNTEYLEVSQDKITGTDGNDTFYAYASQNVNGATTNTLSTGDMVDGGKGSSDKIIGSLINDETVNNTVDFAPMPVINNVEEIRIQALENKVSSTGTGAAAGGELNQVILDADKITGETKYASDSSRADLVITNVDITSTQITNDIKLEMKDTQQNSDFEVYFDQQALIKQAASTTTTAQYFLRVGDGEATTVSPMGNIKIDITINHNGVNKVLTGITSTDGTYAGLVTAIKAKLISEGLGSQYDVKLGDAFTQIETTKDVTSVNGNDILITSLAGVQFTKDALTFSVGTVNSNVANLLASNADVKSNSVVSTTKVESTITVDNVGRGSNGGEIIIGSTSKSVNSTGVERINVIVENSSVVHDISSTNNALKEITLKNGTVKGDFVLTNKKDYNKDKAYTYANVDTDADFEIGLTSITATNFDGNIFLGTDALGKVTADTTAIYNLGTLSANVNGNVTYNAILNDSKAHVVVTGAGNDVSTISLTGTSSVEINTGNGTNTVTLSEAIAATDATKATITGGTGVDTITAGNVSVTVNAGAGNDVIYAENTGDKAIYTYTTKSLTAATAATNTATSASVNQGVDFLYGVQVQVLLNTDGKAAVATEEGFESKLITIKPASGFLTSQDDVNNAIVEAINGSPANPSTLSKIAKAEIVNGEVVVTYLVDGQQIDTGFDVVFSAPTTPLSPTVIAAIENAFEAKYKDSAFFPAHSVSTIQTAAIANANATALDKLSITGTKAVYTLNLVGAVTGGAGDTITFNNSGVSGTYTELNVAGNTAAGIVTAMIATGTITIDTIVYDVTAGANATTVVLTAQTPATELDPMAILVVDNNASGGITQPGTPSQAITTSGVAASTGANSVDNNSVNVINGQEGNDVIVLSSDAGAVTVDFDTVKFTGYNQGDDIIVHFESGVDKLDFSAYLNGKISHSTSVDSQVDHNLGVSVVTTEVFSADGGNFLNFSALNTAAGVTFANMTTAQIETALEAANNGTSIAAVTNLVGTIATSVLIVHADATTATNNDGMYKAYEISYANTTVADTAAKDFTVKLIGSFDLGDDANLVAGDFNIIG